MVTSLIAIAMSMGNTVDSLPGQHEVSATIRVTLTIVPVDQFVAETEYLDEQAGVYAVNLRYVTTGHEDAGTFTARYLIFDEDMTDKPVMFAFLNGQFEYTAQPEVVVMRTDVLDTVFASLR